MKLSLPAAEWRARLRWFSLMIRTAAERIARGGSKGNKRRRKAVDQFQNCVSVGRNRQPASRLNMHSSPHKRLNYSVASALTSTDRKSTRLNSSHLGISY